MLQPSSVSKEMRKLQYKSYMKKCPICGEESEHYVLPTYGNTIYKMTMNLEDCPKCRYISYNINNSKVNPAMVKKIVELDKYKKYLKIDDIYNSINEENIILDDMYIDIFLKHDLSFYDNFNTYSLMYIIYIWHLYEINKYIRISMTTVNKNYKKFSNQYIKKLLNGYKSILKLFNKQLRTGEPFDYLDEVEIDFFTKALFMNIDELQSLTNLTSSNVHKQMMKYYNKYILSNYEFMINA